MNENFNGTAAIFNFFSAVLLNLSLLPKKWTWRTVKLERNILSVLFKRILTKIH